MPDLPIDGDWNYEVDDYGIIYGRAWWPFHRGGQPTYVRAAPDVAYYAWGDEYVLLAPTEDAGGRVSMVVGPADSRLRVEVPFDLRARTFTVPASVTGPARVEASAKARRALALVLEAREQRRSGRPAPLTAAERYEQSSEVR